MRDVFISHSTKNKTKVEAIQSVLADNNISTWYAPDDIIGEDDFTRIIPPAIRGCKCFLLVMSKEAQNSKWVHRELGIADKNNRPVFVFHLDDMPMQDEYELVLQYTQSYPFHLGFEEQMRRFITDYRKKVEKNTIDKPIDIDQSAVSKFTSGSKRKWAVISAVAVIMVALLTALLFLFGGNDADGSYVIWNPQDSVAMSSKTVHEHYMEGSEVYLVDGTVAGYNSACVWELDFAEDNSFTISYNGQLLGMQPGYNGIGFGGDYTENRWILEDEGDGKYFVRNVQTQYYLEWYSAKNNWATYPNVDENRALFQLRLDKVS